MRSVLGGGNEPQRDTRREPVSGRKRAIARRRCKLKADERCCCGGVAYERCMRAVLHDAPPHAGPVPCMLLNSKLSPGLLLVTFRKHHYIDGQDRARPSRADVTGRKFTGLAVRGGLHAQ